MKTKQISLITMTVKKGNLFATDSVIPLEQIQSIYRPSPFVSSLKLQTC
jgi:hypothetical protein